MKRVIKAKVYKCIVESNGKALRDLSNKELRKLLATIN